MQIFYAPGIAGENWVLDEKESFHCIRVLRMKKDTPVRLIDGRGNMYEGLISIPDQKRCVIRIINMISDFEKRPYYLHMAISPLKNPERFEWFIEKSVEIGVDEITPVICRNSEKKNIRKERINGIIISAMKQSLKANLTRLNDPAPFDSFVLSMHRGGKMIAHCPADHKRFLLTEIYTKGSDAVIMIGPEGDFTDDEITVAVNAGFTPLNLGPGRLRTETAGIAACHSIYFINL